MFCTQCERKNRALASYCGYCGAYLLPRSAILKSSIRVLATRVAYVSLFTVIMLICLPYATIVAGNIFFYFGTNRAAIRLYSFACAMNSRSAIGQYDVAVALFKSGDLPNAIYHYKRAIALSPNDPEFYNGLGLALQQYGDFSGAVTAFKEALRLQPG